MPASKTLHMRGAKLGAIAAGATVLLSGCNQAILPDFTTTGSIFATPKNVAFEHAIAEQRPAEEAFVRLPGESGQALQVTQSRYHNGLEQLVVFQGDHATRGENAARVRMVVKRNNFLKTRENLTIHEITRNRILSEMQRELPGVAMRISNDLNSNVYGPFGYALGRTAGNVTCLYGWQQMQARSDERWAFLKGKSASPKLSVRLRICRENIAADRLVDMMRNVQIEADPTRIYQAKTVSWSSGTTGSGAALTTAMPTFDIGGYVSNERLADPEPVVRTVSEPVAKRRKTAVKRQASSQRRTVRKVAVVKEEPVSLVPYSPPLPSDVAPATSRALPVATAPQTTNPEASNAVNIVPAPVVPQVQAKVETTPIVPAIYPVPSVAPATTTITATSTSGAFAAVPLPN